MNELTGFTKVTIGGKERPVKYGWNSLRLLEERTKVNALNPYEISQALLTASFRTAVVVVGLIEGCRVTKTEVDFTENDVGDWLDREGFRRVQEFAKLFSDSISDASMIGMGEEEKKSLIKLSHGALSDNSLSERSDSSQKSSGT
jgi:hypothetical protein